jgi:hypothetical protein
MGASRAVARLVLFETHAHYAAVDRALLGEAPF